MICICHQGTGIAANFMATHMDPELWDAPEQFRPERSPNTATTTYIIHCYCDAVPRNNFSFCIHFLKWGRGGGRFLDSSGSRLKHGIIVQFRFLNEDGTGLRETSHFFPFSVGKRVIFLPFSTMLMDSNHDYDDSDDQNHDDDDNWQWPGVFGWKPRQGGALYLLHSTGQPSLFRSDIIFWIHCHFLCSDASSSRYDALLHTQ